MQKQDLALPRQGQFDRPSHQNYHHFLLNRQCYMWIWTEDHSSIENTALQHVMSCIILYVSMQDGTSGKRHAPTKHGRQWTEQCCCEQATAVCGWHWDSSRSTTAWGFARPR